LGRRVWVVSLEIPYYSFNFYCPLCGTRIISGEEGEQGESGAISPCPHLLFIYDPDIRAFEYLREDLKAKLEGKGVRIKEGEELEEVEELKEDKDLLDILKPLLPRNTVVFELTGSGLACGPVEYTVVVGIEFKEYQGSRES